MTDEAPGWDAIDAAVNAITNGVRPTHYGADGLPGQGIYALNAYPVEGAWLLHTYGLTELFSKESDDPDTSGWGFELTMRTPRDTQDDQPPMWALNLLRQLGNYVFTSGNPFAPGHRVNAGGPLTGEPGCALTAVAFAADPELNGIDTPHGRVEFRRLIGITADELAEMQAGTSAAVIDRLRAASPDLTTDPHRG